MINKKKLGQSIYETKGKYGTYTIVLNDKGNYFILLDGVGHSSSVNPLTNKTNTYLDKFVNNKFESKDEILILGNSIGATMTMLQNKKLDLNITGVEIDSKITDLGKKWFNLKLDKNSKIVHEDAKIFVNKCSKKYNYIFVDLYDSQGIPSHTITKEFYFKVKKLLKKKGIIQINIAFDMASEKSSLVEFREIYFNTLNKVFGKCSIDYTTHIITHPPIAEEDIIFSKTDKLFTSKRPIDKELQSKVFKK